MGENNQFIWWSIYVGILAWRFQGLRRILTAYPTGFAVFAMWAR